MVSTLTDFSTNGHSYGHTADGMLCIDPPSIRLDHFARLAFQDTLEKFEQLSQEHNTKPALLKQRLYSRISDLSERLNSSRLDDISHLLLSNVDLYAVLIEQALTELTVEEVRAGDLEGLYDSVLRLVNQYPRRYFLARLLNHVTAHKRIDLNSDKEKRWDRLDNLLISRGIDIRHGKVVPAVNALLNTLTEEGDIPYYLEKYIKRSRKLGFTEDDFTPEIKRGMIEHLGKQRLLIGEQEFEQGKFDNHFLLAFNEAQRISSAADDPIDALRMRGGELTWDFTVDTFETVEEQGILPSNIMAAGALDYLYYIGEQMHVFDVANALVLRWAKGMLDIPEGKVATMLYRFYKLRSERSTSEERAMLYKRVLNKGDARLLSNMVVNEPFTAYWMQLMSEAAEYISKSEGSRWFDGRVSRSSIYQATKTLQSNLTENMNGMAHRQVHEDYKHLQEALDILKSEEIIAEFGGRRKSVWSVIQQVAREDLGMAVKTSSLRTLAVEGNKIFKWLAYFNQGAVKDEEFKAFITAAEAWILAQSSLQSGGKIDPDMSMDDMDPDMDDDDDDDDDFDDWDV